MKSATAILTEIRNGAVVSELSEELDKAMRSVQDNPSKDAKVVLTITISQLTKMKLSEPALGYSAEIVTKLAKPTQEETIFFVDASGDPTRNPTKQSTLDLSIAKTGN
jgi:hypothetical protein